MVNQIWWCLRLQAEIDHLWFIFYLVDQIWWRIRFLSVDGGPNLMVFDIVLYYMNFLALHTFNEIESFFTVRFVSNFAYNLNF